MTSAKSTWAPMCVMAQLLLIACAPAAGQQPAASPAAAVRQFRDAVAFQDRGVYDLAADEWQKFLDEFPSDPLAPQARHYLGVCRLLLKQYDAAVKNFVRVIREHPDSELADATHLNLGLAQYSIAQAGKPEAYDDAIKTFAALAAKFPKSKELAQALYYQGEALYARDKKQAAAKAYAKLIDEHPDSPRRGDALYALGVAQQDLERVRDAGAAFDRFLKEFPKHKLRSEVILRRAETLFSQDQFEAAGRWFASAAASKNFAMADLAAIRQAQSLEAAKQPAQAAALYATIGKRFPKSSYVATALLAAGNAYAQAGDVEAAIAAYRELIARGGQLTDDAAHQLARLYLKNDQPADALATVQPVLGKSRGADFEVELLLDEADALYEFAKSRNEAIAKYAALAKRHPSHELAPQALYLAAFGSLSQGEYQQAAAYSDQFVDTYADHTLAVDVRFVAAEAALQLGEPARAEQLYAGLTTEHPDHADHAAWQVRRAVALGLQDKYDEVVAALDPVAARLEPPELRAEALYLLGAAYAERDDGKQAAAALRASVAAAPRGKYADQALFKLAAVQRGANQTEQALATLAKLSADFPESNLADQAAYRSGQYAAAAGDLAAAGKHYRRVVDQWPDSGLGPQALYGLAWTQLNSGDHAAAEASLGRLLANFPRHASAPQAHYARATAREQQAKYEGAIADLQAFLASDPPPGERLDATYTQGLCLVGLERFDQAAAAFRSILAAKAEFADTDKVLYELAWALRALDKRDEALRAFAKLAEEHADSPLAAESVYHLGEDAYGRGDFAGAAAHYASARQRSGRDALGEKATHKLGWSHYRGGELDAAAKTFDAQLRDFPEGELAADAQFMLAEALFGEKQYDAALAAYEKSFARPAANAEFAALAHLHAGQALAQQQKWQQSAQLLDRAIDQFADSAYLPELRYESAWAQQNLGQLGAAQKGYEQVVNETDRAVSARARFMIGEILFEKREFKEAIRNFFKVAYGYGYPDAPDAVRPWQADATYEAARCFEVLEMTDQARKSYQEVVERYPTSDKAPLAKTRLEALGQ